MGIESMRKQSNMGGGRFEFNPNDLDKRFRERNEIYDSAFQEAWASIQFVIDNHVKPDLVSRDSLTESICRKLVERFIQQRG
jgi:hypothetical protein